MDECFEFFDLKSRIMASFDTPPLDVNFGHLLTGSNFSDRPCGGRGDGDDDGKNDQDNGEGGGRGQGLLEGERHKYGARHGYGANLANIFSERLSILGLDFKK